MVLTLPLETSYIFTVASLLAIATTAPVGSNATLLAGCGPTSKLTIGATVLTSQSLTVP